MVNDSGRFGRALFISAGLSLLSACSAIPQKQGDPAWPCFTLEAEKTFLLNTPGGARFDASGLLLTPTGDMLTVNDRGPTLYRIEFLPDGVSADLKPVAGCFTTTQLAPLAPPGGGHLDCEGIAQDEQGRFYLCEEVNRWVLRCDPKANQAERLPIDWSPVKHFFGSDQNASFEGIAIGGGRLYLANERSSALIIAVDPVSLKIIDHFVVSPQVNSFLGMLHYSDLSWQDGKLFVLCRHHRVVLAVDPRTHAVLAEFNYREAEEKLGYATAYPTGLMEGLAVDHDFIWLVTDNNGLGRKTSPNDSRPTLLKCRRPDRK
jgi:hypothetical protein